MKRKSIQKKKIVSPRIKRMIEDWKKDHWTSSRISNDDTDFFIGIGKRYDSVGVISYTGNDVQYYNTSKLVPWGMGLITKSKYREIQKRIERANKKKANK